MRAHRNAAGKYRLRGEAYLQLKQYGRAKENFAAAARLKPDLAAAYYGLATLYRNLGGGCFEDVTRITRAGEGTLPHVTWGNGLIDFDKHARVDRIEVRWIGGRVDVLEGIEADRRIVVVEGSTKS